MIFTTNPRFRTATLVGALMACGHGGAAANAQEAIDPKERYAYAETLRQGADVKLDPEKAFAIQTELAAAGYVRAQDKLAYHYARGAGVEADPEAASRWYRAAIENGRGGSRISFAKHLMRQGDFEQAKQQLESAVDEDVHGAEAFLALSHNDGALGGLSRKREGKAALVRLAKEGDARAMQYILLRMAEGARFDIDRGSLVTDALEIALDREHKDHAKVIEGLLPYFRKHGSREMRVVRAQLLKAPKLRGKVHMTEALYLAHETSRREFAQNAQAIITQTDGVDYGRALFITSRLDINAYVHVLQNELRTREYFDGRSSGRMNRPTIRAALSYCRDAGIHDVCRLGPLKAVSIKAIAQALAFDREP